MASKAAVLPGQTVIPDKYSDTMVLYSFCNPVECVVDGARPGPNGRLFRIPVDRPTKVPYEAGRFILEHMAYTGVVRVQEKELEDGSGVAYLTKEAKAESKALTEQQDLARFHRWVSDMVEDYVKRGKPVPEPDEAIRAIIERRGYDPRRFGIVPIGWEEPDKDKRITEMQETIEGLQRQLASLSKAQQPKT